jgi:hypothetical protein
VILPPNSPDKPSLDELLAKEAAKEVPATPATLPPAPATDPNAKPFDPNTAL